MIETVPLEHKAPWPESGYKTSWAFCRCLNMKYAFRSGSIVSSLPHTTRTGWSMAVRMEFRAMAFRARGFLSFELDDQIFVERARMADSESM
jgi:hypothetical protein